MHTQLKYNNDGEQLWRAQSYTDRLAWEKLAVHALGNVFVIGTGEGGDGPKWYTSKYEQE